MSITTGHSVYWLVFSGRGSPSGSAAEAALSSPERAALAAEFAGWAGSKDTAVDIWLRAGRCEYKGMPSQSRRASLLPLTAGTVGLIASSISENPPGCELHSQRLQQDLFPWTSERRSLLLPVSPRIAAIQRSVLACRL